MGRALMQLFPKVIVNKVTRKTIWLPQNKQYNLGPENSYPCFSNGLDPFGTFLTGSSF